MNIDVHNFQFRRSQRIQDEVTPNRLESMRQAICRSMPMRQPGIRMTPNGWMLDRSIMRGGGASRPLGQLVLTDRQPNYSNPNPNPQTPAVWVTWGIVSAGVGGGLSGVEISGLEDPIIVPSNGNYLYVWVRINFSPRGELLSASKGTGDSMPVQPAPNETTGDIPTHGFFNLGRVRLFNDRVEVAPTGEGSIGYWISSQPIRTVLPTPDGKGGIIYQREVAFYRLSA